MMKTTPLFTSIEDLVLHRPPMLLLESIATWDDSGLEAVANPQDSYLFADANGDVPVWVGIEYMAQAISAFSGLTAKIRGEALGIGFLLGTRRYTAEVVSFAAAQKLSVRVRELLKDDTGLVLFDCHIYAGERLLASAEIKAIQPDDANKVLAHINQ